MNEIKEKLEAEFPIEFLTTYGPRFYPIVAVLGEMAGRAETDNIYHAANLFRLLVNSAMAAASGVRQKAADEWRPGWVV